MRRLIIGCGYLGARVAERWQAQGDQVLAVTRSPNRAEDFRRRGWEPVVADVLDRGALAALPEADTLLYAVGYDRSAGVSQTRVYVEGVENVMALLPAAVQRVVYISSTGVYGQVHGEWIDEETPCHPTREGGRASLQAERLWQASPWGANTVVLRLAGIYGPGRIPRASSLKAGEPIAAPAKGHLNLIHVDDAAAIVVKAADQPRLATCYNVCDGHPPIRQAYYEELARLLGAPAPTFTDPPANSPAAERAGSDKRVRNARLLADLQPEFQYPSFRQGLAAIVASAG